VAVSLTSKVIGVAADSAAIASRLPIDGLVRTDGTAVFLDEVTRDVEGAAVERERHRQCAVSAVELD
jgi:hypothetical protein